jgi:hypothetical protein
MSKRSGCLVAIAIAALPPIEIPTIAFQPNCSVLTVPASAAATT